MCATTSHGWSVAPSRRKAAKAAVAGMPGDGPPPNPPEAGWRPLAASRRPASFIRKLNLAARAAPALVVSIERRKGSPRAPFIAA